MQCRTVPAIPGLFITSELIGQNLSNACYAKIVLDICKANYVKLKVSESLLTPKRVEMKCLAVPT